MGVSPGERQLTDGEAGFSLGVNSLSFPSSLRDGQFAWGYNCVTKGDFISTRPGYRSLLRLTAGYAQGLTLFTPTTGRPHLVFAVSGYIYVSPYPFDECRVLPNIRFSAFVDHIVFKEALVAKTPTEAVTPYAVLMMQDGRSRAAYWDGSISRHLDPNPTGAKETKLGLWMEWVGWRLWVANGTQLFASDIYDPLHFTENTYVAEGGSLQAIDGQIITALKKTADNKELLVGTQDNTTAIQAGVTDRDSWKEFPNFVAMRFPGVGWSAGKGIADVSGELMWMSKEGVRKYNAVGESVRSAKNPVSSQEMQRSFKGMSPIMSRTCAFAFGSYAGFSVPSGDILNRHTWVLDTSSSDLLTQQLPLSWQGVWTGTRPVEWASGFVIDRNRCFFISQDEDAPRIWEAFIGQDDNGHDIQAFAETRGHVFERPSGFKEFNFGEIHMTEIADMLNIKVDYRTEFTCWKEIADRDFCVEMCNPFSCGPFSANRRQSRYFKTQEAKRVCNEGGSPYHANVGTSIQMRFRWMGKTSIRMYRMTANDFLERNTGECKAGEECIVLNCCDPEPDYISISNDSPPYYYHECSLGEGALSL